MTQYYVEKEGKIQFVDEDLQRLKNTLAFLPDYIEEDIKKVKKGYIIDNFELKKTKDYQTEQLEKARVEKYNEALDGAREFINTGALYRYDDNNTIEATDGNIGKLTAYAMALQSGVAETVTWTSKEDNVLTLNAEQVATILQGLGAVQANVWNVQYIAYKNAIEAAASLEELNAISIGYTSEIPTEVPTEEPTQSAGESVDDNSTDTTADTVSDEVESKDDTSTAEQNNTDTDTVQETKTTDTGSADTEQEVLQTSNTVQSSGAVDEV